MSATKKKPANDVLIHASGHRDRLRDRFRRSGADALADYEILELILFRAVPRGDVKPLAKKLLSRFGNFSEVLSAPRALLASVPGAGARVADEIKIVNAATIAAARDKILKRPLLSSWPDVINYCQRKIGYERIEQFHVFFLDAKNHLIVDEIQQTGTINYAKIYPREIAARALALSATSVILVHNHPSGDPQPSQEDIEITKDIVNVCKSLDITVHDHIIVGRGAMTNFKNLNLL